MDPYLVDLLEPGMILGTLLGTAFGVKILIWGKGPIKRVRGGGTDQSALENHVTDLEDRLERIAEFCASQTARLEDLDERIDFAERLLTRDRVQSNELKRPEASTPV